MMKSRTLLLGALLATGFALSPPMASARSIYVEIAPPTPRHEVIPSGRAGYVWAPGYWNWRHGRHVWAAGHWERARPGYAWSSPRWEHEGNRWRYVNGRWDQDRNRRDRGRDHDRHDRDHDRDRDYRN